MGVQVSTSKRDTEALAWLCKYAQIPGCMGRLLDGPETPQEHVRTALMLLGECEQAIRSLGLILTGDQAIDIYVPLTAARGRLWRAVEMLEQGTTTSQE